MEEERLQREELAALSARSRPRLTVSAVNRRRKRPKLVVFKRNRRIVRETAQKLLPSSLPRPRTINSVTPQKRPALRRRRPAKPPLTPRPLKMLFSLKGHFLKPKQLLGRKRPGMRRIVPNRLRLRRWRDRGSQRTGLSRWNNPLCSQSITRTLWTSKLGWRTSRPHSTKGGKSKASRRYGNICRGCDCLLTGKRLKFKSMNKTQHLVLSFAVFMLGLSCILLSIEMIHNNHRIDALEHNVSIIESWPTHQDFSGQTGIMFYLTCTTNGVTVTNHP